MTVSYTHLEAQLFLKGIRKSRLEDENLISALFEKIANSYQFPDDYLIALVHGCYDIPGKGTDGSEQFDASDEVYEYIQCILCPVALSKSGLAYNVETNSIMAVSYTHLDVYKRQPDVITEQCKFLKQELE